MKNRPIKKGTLLIPSGPSHDPGRLHLFVICTDTCENGLQVLVPIASLLNDLCDKTCLLGKHEHRYLIKRSYVLYRKSRLEPSKALIEGIREGIFATHDNMNSQTFL